MDTSPRHPSPPDRPIAPRRRRRATATAVAAATAFALMGPTPVARAAHETFLADTLSDNPADGYTLREALADANGHAGADTVGFVDGLDGTLTLTAGQLVVSDHLTLQGPATGDVVISGGGASRILFSFTPGVDLTIRDLGFTDGNSGFLGGAIAIYQGNDIMLDGITVSDSTSATHGGGVSIGALTGRVDITDSTFENNQTATGDGGGLYMVENDDGDQIDIFDSTFVGNSAAGNGGGIYADVDPKAFQFFHSVANANTAVGDGGGIYVNASYVGLEHVGIADNTAGDDHGGIYLRSTAANVNLLDATVTGNTAAGDGGAGRLQSADTIHVTASTITDNTATVAVGGLRLSATAAARVRTSRIADNEAAAQIGGLLVANTTTAEITESSIEGNTAPGAGGLRLDNVDGTTIQRSTIADNSATAGDGGGILANGAAPDTVAIRHSTVSGNEATGDGGGIWSSSVGLGIGSSTIVGNTAGGTGGGTRLNGGAVLTLDHSILTDNTAASFPNTTGPMAANWSILGDTTGVPLLGGGDNIGDDPLLGPLAHNGGPTRTHLPQPGSPAIDGGNPMALVFSQSDQRLFPRPVGTLDIGSVELTSDEISLWVPVTPARVVDTRTTGETIDGLDEGDGRFAVGEERTYDIAGRAGIPGDARGVIANITAIQPSTNGYTTTHPCAVPTPVTASLNYTTGVNLGNEVIVGLDTGSLCVFSSAEADYTVDVVGYIPALSPYVPIEPARYLDSRAGGTTLDGDFAGIGAPGAGQEVTIDIASRGDVPADVDTVVMYVAAVQPDATGFVTVWNCESERPLASSLNHVAGVNRGNEIVMTLNHDGQVCLYTSANADLTIDVVGFVPPSPTNFGPLDTPSRLLDTRAGATTVDGLFAGDGKLDAGDVLELQVGGRAGLPVTPRTVTMNLTAVNPEAVGWLTAFPCGGAPPLAASVNFVPGVNGGNEIVAATDDQGRVCIFTSARVDVTVDATGSTAV